MEAMNCAVQNVISKYFNGFTVDEEERIPLENGMVNVDYKMRLTKNGFVSKKS